MSISVSEVGGPHKARLTHHTHTHTRTTLTHTPALLPSPEVPDRPDSVFAPEEPPTSPVREGGVDLFWVCCVCVYACVCVCVCVCVCAC